MKAVAPTTFARMSESLMSRKPLHKRLSRGFATRRSLPPIVEKNWRQKLPGGSPQGCEMPVLRTDNGPQFVSADFNNACAEFDIEHEYISTKTPNKIAHIESFHSLLQQACLSRYEFATFTDA